MLLSFFLISFLQCADRPRSWNPLNYFASFLSVRSTAPYTQGSLEKRLYVPEDASLGGPIVQTGTEIPAPLPEKLLDGPSFDDDATSDDSDEEGEASKTPQSWFKRARDCVKKNARITIGVGGLAACATFLICYFTIKRDPHSCPGIVTPTIPESQVIESVLANITSNATAALSRGFHALEIPSAGLIATMAALLDPNRIGDDCSRYMAVISQMTDQSDGLISIHKFGKDATVIASSRRAGDSSEVIRWERTDRYPVADPLDLVRNLHSEGQCVVLRGDGDLLPQETDGTVLTGSFQMPGPRGMRRFQFLRVNRFPPELTPAPITPQPPGTTGAPTSVAPTITPPPAPTSALATTTGVVPTTQKPTVTTTGTSAMATSSSTQMVTYSTTTTKPPTLPPTTDVPTTTMTDALTTTLMETTTTTVALPPLTTTSTDAPTTTIVPTFPVKNCTFYNKWVTEYAANPSRNSLVAATFQATPCTAAALTLSIHNISATDMVDIIPALQQLDLTALAMPRNIFGDVGASLLGPILQYYPKLGRLELEENGIGKIGTRSLMPFIQKLDKLWLFSFGANPIDDEVALELAATLKQLPKLIALGLNVNTTIATRLLLKAELVNITSLDVG